MESNAVNGYLEKNANHEGGAEKLIIDTDPGIDDSMTILMAFQTPELEILGLTTIFGNVTTKDATKNALRLCEIRRRGSFYKPPLSSGCHVTGCANLEVDRTDLDGKFWISKARAGGVEVVEKKTCLAYAVKMGGSFVIPSGIEVGVRDWWG